MVLKLKWWNGTNKRKLAEDIMDNNDYGVNVMLKSPIILHENVSI